MNAANWLTLVASVVAFLAVVVSYILGKKQLQNAAFLAGRQIEAAAQDTARRLRGEILLKDRQAWIKEFRDAINEIVYLGDPDLDERSQTFDERLRTLDRLGHKIDLLLPVGKAHADLIAEISSYVGYVREADTQSQRERLANGSRIITLTRRILR